jgi:hypothetical protein
MGHEQVTVEELIERFWIVRDHDGWIPKTETIALQQLLDSMKCEDIEVLGFLDGLLHDGRFRVEPALSSAQYVDWIKHYYERCFRENPDGEWSESSYSAGWALVRVFIHLWDDETVPRELLNDLKAWLADTYKQGDSCLRTCIVNASLEHMFERKLIRKYFSDWQKDPILAVAFSEACLWDRKTPLSE